MRGGCPHLGHTFFLCFLTVFRKGPNTDFRLKLSEVFDNGTVRTSTIAQYGFRQRHSTEIEKVTVRFSKGVQSLEIEIVRCSTVRKLIKFGIHQNGNEKVGLRKMTFR